MRGLRRLSTSERHDHSHPFRFHPEATVKKIFLDPNGRLRNGWWILVFIALMVASRFVYTPVSRALQELRVPADLFEPLRFAFLLGVTWICVRLRREPLSSIGFVLDARWARELGVGTFFGLATALLAVAMIWAAGGVRLELDPARSLATMAQGAWMFLFVALFEETLFRGFVFQRLVAGAGPWIAQISLGLLFAAGHWGNPDMHGATFAWATVELFTGAVLLGLAYLRTRSLAMPVGIHLGWNWAQGNLLGFGVSGFAQSGWFHPLLMDRPEWVTGGRFGPEASIFAVVVDVSLILVLWKWKGVAARPDASDAASMDFVATNPQPASSGAGLQSPR
jgi:membrane protease YdiL (CAAX protease family)